MSLMTSTFGDPVIARAIAATLAVIFLTAAWYKLRDRETFLATLSAYRLLPAAWLPAVAWLLPLAELLAGGGLLFTASLAPSALLAAGLLIVVSAAVAINLRRGYREIDCGCGALGVETPLSWGLVLRNLALLAALPLVMMEGRRELFWVDYLSVAGATLALLGLYALVSQMLAIQPRLGALRNS